MKFVIGLLLGLAVGFAAAMVVSSRQERVDEVVWAGEDRTPPAMPQDDGMATPAGAGAQPAG